MTAATLARQSTRGRPCVRSFERGQSSRPHPVPAGQAQAAAVRSHTASAVLRGALTVPQAAEIWAMLGIIPDGVKE